MSREMTSTEIAAVLVRNPSVAAQVAATHTAMGVLSFDQIVSPPEWYQYDINIGLVPPWGVSVDDSTYGTVLISWDANGNWHYITDSPVASTVINAPWFTSTPSTPAGTPTPPCDPTTNDLSGWMCAAGGYVKTALVLGGLYMLYVTFGKRS